MSLLHRHDVSSGWVSASDLAEMEGITEGLRAAGARISGGLLHTTASSGGSLHTSFGSRKPTTSSTEEPFSTNSRANEDTTCENVVKMTVYTDSLHSVRILQDFFLRAGTVSHADRTTEADGDAYRKVAIEVNGNSRTAQGTSYTAGATNR